MMMMGKKKKITETMCASERRTTTDAEALTFCCYQRRTPLLLLSPLLRFLPAVKKLLIRGSLKAPKHPKVLHPPPPRLLACNTGRRIQHLKPNLSELHVSFLFPFNRFFKSVAPVQNHSTWQQQRDNINRFFLSFVFLFLFFSKILRSMYLCLTSPSFSCCADTTLTLVRCASLQSCHSCCNPPRISHSILRSSTSYNVQASTSIYHNTTKKHVELPSSTPKKTRTHTHTHKQQQKHS